MRLRDLEAKLIRCEIRAGRQAHIEVESLDQAGGVMFLCPACYIANNGPIGTHAVICWSRSRGTPDEAVPGPGRWRLDGTGLDDLTLNAEQPGGARSVQLNGGCGWHGFVTDGDAA